MNAIKNIKRHKNIILKGLGVAALIFTVAFFTFEILMEKRADVTYMNYADFLERAESGGISEVTLSDGPLMKFKINGSDVSYETDNPRSSSLKEELLTLGISVSEGGYVSAGRIVQTGLSVCFIAAVVFAGYKITSKKGKTKNPMALELTDNAGLHATRFCDVAGSEEAKESVSDIVDFIKNPGKYAKLGARMPRGVIFYGSPGTGKTLMAKAIAGEAGVPFYAVSGSDFVQMYVGVGAGRIRELFSKARESGKAVIFIDEIDALGKKRSSAAVSGNDERDQTLNALLTEMSGFSSSEGIVVIAATNRLDALDEALLRPGRFDRQIEIGLPDMAGRLGILKLHAKNKPLSDKVDLCGIARQTVYFSGAALENLLNEAAIFAAKAGADEISREDIDRAYYTVLAGSEKKDRSSVRERDRKITAFHESGHALAAKIASPENTVSKVTIIPSAKGAGGFCVNIPPDKMYYTKKEIEAQVIVSLAGRAAEELIFGAGEITTGAGNDLEKAAGIVADYITKYGMSDGIKFVRAKNIGGEAAVFDEYSSQMERLYNETKALLTENIGKLRALAEALLERDALDEDEIDAIVA